MITEEQRLARRSYIGGSDAPAVVNADQFSSRYELFLEKTGRLKRKRVSPAMEVGTYLELGVVAWAEQKLDAEIVRDMPTLTAADGIRASNLDGWIPTKSAVVEAKTSGIVSGRLNEEWGEPGTSSVPKRVIVQATHNMSVAADYFGAPVERAFVPACLVGLGLVMYVVPFNQRLADRLRDAELEFWRNNVLAGVPPDEDDDIALDVLQDVIRAQGKTVELPDPLADVWQHARTQRLGWEKEEKRALAAILQHLGDAEIGKTSKGQFTYLEQQRDAYSVAASSFRVPRFKANK